MSLPSPLRLISHSPPPPSPLLPSLLVCDLYAAAAWRKEGEVGGRMAAKIYAPISVKFTPANLGQTLFLPARLFFLLCNTLKVN